jgi:DNA-binding response OmpR family regulator
MSDPCILIVEQDLLVRTPLAEYLRECGYLVLEASSIGDARTLLEDGSRRVDIVLAEGLVTFATKERDGACNS